MGDTGFPDEKRNKAQFRAAHVQFDDL